MEVGIAVAQAFTIFHSVGVGGDDTQPVLDADVVLANLGNALQRFMVRADEELGRSEVTAEVFNGPKRCCQLRG